jgi:hypothetical protein
MAGQVKQQEVSIKKATVATGIHSTPTSGRRRIIKRNYAALDVRKGQSVPNINNGQPALSTRSNLSCDNPGRSKASPDPNHDI